MPWVPTPRGVRRWLGVFAEPNDHELRAYAYCATDLTQREHPTCGSPGTGRRMHYRLGEPVCDDCRAAEARYQNERYHRRKEDG